MKVGALASMMTRELADTMYGLASDRLAALEEIRVYCGRPVEFICKGETICTGLVMDRAKVDALLASLSGYALYRFERQMAQGYIPLPDGHRAGICGRLVFDDGVCRMSEVSSICLRVAGWVPGACKPVRSHLIHGSGRIRRVLFFGEPRSGKTTVLRDAACWLSREQGIHIAVADEREELFPDAGEGSGYRLDVLSGVKKAEAMRLLIRSMAPQAIVTDEIGREEDADALEDAARCGIGLLASAHAGSIEELLARPVLRNLLHGRIFERYILIGRDRRFGVWDEKGQRMDDEEDRYT